MNLSERDKKLLIVLGIFLVVVIIYMLPYQSLKRQESQLKMDISTMQNEYDMLSIDIKSPAEYETLIAEANEKITKIENMFPSSVTQEEIITYIKSVEDELKLMFPSIAFQQPSVILVSESGTEQLVKIAITTNIMAGYDQFKQFLLKIREPENKINIDNLVYTMNSLAAVDASKNMEIVPEVVGSFSLNFFALVSPDRPIEGLKLDNIPTEKGKIIGDPSNTVVEDGVVVNSRPQDSAKDMILVLNPFVSDNATVDMGLASDLDGFSAIKADNEGLETIEIRFKESNGKYLVSYRTSTSSFPTSYTAGYEFVPGNVIEIEVIGRERVADTDKSGANVTVINETNMPAYIVISQDDTQRPRFNLVNTSGQVIVE